MKTDGLNWLSATMHLPSPAVEAASDWFFELGARAVWEDSPDASGRAVLVGGFEPEERDALAQAWPERRAILTAAFNRPAGEFELELQLEENHDWAEKWKEGLAPISVEDRLIVAPTWWTEADWPAEIPVLRLDPGLAFGSGHHASTWLALKALLDLTPLSGRVLDLGAGSGILALAAAQFSQPGTTIIGIDNDPDTIEVARENAADNGLAERIDFSARPLSALEPPFDLILANITQNILLELAPEISRLAGRGTPLILSGLLREQAETVTGGFTSFGWRPLRRQEREEWAALTFISSDA